MVESNRGQDNDLPVRHIGTIPGAAHADLHNGGIDGGVGEGRKCHCRQNFEPGESNARLSVD
jgi:hypothetical protein